jgi:D-aminoacyl-tRNA deacylase
MKIVIQRVKRSKVSVGQKVVGSIGAGLNLLICLEKKDEGINLNKVAQKILNLRVFLDENLKMNKSVLDIKGELLCISQFTLSWNGQGGNRPGFDNSMAPKMAEKLLDSFVRILGQKVKVETGQFGEAMEVEIINDGPVTFSLSF